jgi:hypothetical protein
MKPYLTLEHVLEEGKTWDRVKRAGRTIAVGAALSGGAAAPAIAQHAVKPQISSQTSGTLDSLSNLAGQKKPGRHPTKEMIKGFHRKFVPDKSTREPFYPGTKGSTFYQGREARPHQNVRREWGNLQTQNRAGRRR